MSVFVLQQQQMVDAGRKQLEQLMHQLQVMLEKQNKLKYTRFILKC